MIKRTIYQKYIAFITIYMQPNQEDHIYIKQSLTDLKKRDWQKYHKVGDFSKGQLTSMDRSSGKKPDKETLALNDKKWENQLQYF